MLTMEKEKTGTISQFVDEIIEARKSKRPALMRKKQELEAILSMLDRFDAMKNQIIDEDGNVIPGKYQQIVRKNPDMPAKLLCLQTKPCREHIQKAMTQCDAAINRFNRNRINVGIVGMARNGKSLTLQSITDLDDRVIPTSDKSDCTGAVSIIENWPDMPRGEVKATITFKTEQQMVDIIQSYLDVLITDPAKKITIYSMEQIATIDMMDVANRMEQFSVAGNKKNHLAKYVEHYQIWAPLVKKGGTLDLSDPGEIQPYVAQHDPKETEFYYENLAVETCVIRCAFDYRDAGKITLVDSVGLGDTKLGIADDMIEVVKDKSDVVIFLHKPTSGAGGAVPEDIELIYNKIYSACPDKNLNDWMSWLINEDKRDSNHAYLTQAALKTIESSGWAGAIKKIVDVSQKEELRKNFIIPVLESMRKNLGKIDALYLKDLETALDSVRGAYGILCNGAEELLDSKIGDSLAQHGHREKYIDQMTRNLNGKLRALAMEEKEKREVPCTILQDRVETILDDMRTGAMVPDKKKLLNEIQHSENVLDVYLENVNNLRNTVVQMFSEVDGSLGELVKETKNAVANVLLSEEGCRLNRVLACAHGQEPYEWLGEFAQLHLSDKLYPNLYAACEKVCDFDFSVNGFLTYEVRACLDPIDPDLSAVPNFNVGTDVKVAEAIYSTLLVNLIYVAEKLEENLTILFEKPHRAFFAMVKEFKDKVQHSENVDYEWKNLFAKHFDIIWEEEFKEMVTSAYAFGDWEKLTLEMRKLNNNVKTLNKIV